jgi:ERCC4-type nuclease
MQRIRDEAHRFMITAHRSLRTDGYRPQLDAIPGVGPARRRALFKHFGSLDAIRAADADAIATVPGIPATWRSPSKEHKNRLKSNSNNPNQFQTHTVTPNSNSNFNRISGRCSSVKATANLMCV